MRVTYSGEFLHAAPWSVGSPGPRQRLARLHRHEHRERRLALRHSRRGDVVEYTGTDRPMTLTNGYGDWNDSYAAYAVRLRPVLTDPSPC